MIFFTRYLLDYIIVPHHLSTFDKRPDALHKVLAIDGGGIRGIIPATILAEIQTRLGMDLFKAFDLIREHPLAYHRSRNRHWLQTLWPYSPGELLDLYVQNGPAIFGKIF